MTEPDLGVREAARERQSHVRHELRAPLAVMYPALSLLLDGTAGELSPKQREYLEILERNAERLECFVAGATESGWLDCAGAAVGRKGRASRSSAPQAHAQSPGPTASRCVRSSSTCSATRPSTPAAGASSGSE